MSDEVYTLLDELGDLYHRKNPLWDALVELERGHDASVRALGALCMDPNNYLSWSRTDDAIRALRTRYEIRKAVLEAELSEIDEELETHRLPRKIE